MYAGRANLQSGLEATGAAILRTWPQEGPFGKLGQAAQVASKGRALYGSTELQHSHGVS